MIEKLTKAQEKKVPVYLKKWLKLGYRTKTVDQKKARKAVNFLYEKIMKTDKPKYVVFLDSPMACQLAFNLIKNTKFDSQLDSQLRSQLHSQLDSQLGSQLYSQLDSQLDSQLGSQLRSQLRSQLYSQLGSQLHSQLGSQLGSQLHSQLGSQLRSQLDSQLDSQLRSQLGSQLRSQLRSQLGSQLGSQLYSQLGSQLRSQLDSQLRSQLGSQLRSQQLEYADQYFTNLWWGAGYYGFYDYVLHELLPKKKKEFALFRQFLGVWPELHYFLVFKDVVFVSDFPKEINVNADSRLHKDGGAALLYRDTYAIYRLNGVNVSKEVAEIPAASVKKQMILGEQNADVRRELVRKVGIERTIELLGAEVVDTYKSKVGGKYELLLVDYDSRGKRPFLKMSNPSIDAVHIEGVRPGITTVKDAICYRNGLQQFEEPEELA